MSGRRSGSETNSATNETIQVTHSILMSHDASSFMLSYEEGKMHWNLRHGVKTIGIIYPACGAKGPRVANSLESCIVLFSNITAILLLGFEVVGICIPDFFFLRIFRTEVFIPYGNFFNFSDFCFMPDWLIVPFSCETGLI